MKRKVTAIKRPQPQPIGVDGWPISSPEHKAMREVDLKGARERYIRRELEVAYRSWRAGNNMAIALALDTCSKCGCPPPRWTIKAVESLVSVYAPLSRTDQIHFMRWDAVSELRDRKEELAQSPAALKPTWDDAYENAAAILKKTIAAGGAEAMRKSYQRVNREMKSGKGAKYLVVRPK